MYEPNTYRTTQEATGYREYYTNGHTVPPSSRWFAAPSMLSIDCTLQAIVAIVVSQKEMVLGKLFFPQTGPHAQTH